MSRVGKEDRDGMRERHVQCCDFPNCPDRDVCQDCMGIWPCDALRLLDALDEADRREQAVRAVRDRILQYGGNENITGALLAALEVTP